MTYESAAADGTPPLAGTTSHSSCRFFHLSIVIAYFFYRCTAVRTSSNSSVSPEIAIRAPMNNDRSSGGSSNGTTPPPSAGNDHEVAPPPPYPTFGGLLDAEVSFDGEQGPPVRSAGPALAQDAPRVFLCYKNTYARGLDFTY